MDIKYLFISYPFSHFLKKYSNTHTHTHTYTHTEGEKGEEEVDLL